MTQEIRLEIHSHSTVSDGGYPPQQLAQLMADHEVDVWALTDHDTIDGCESASEAAAELGIDFVPGIEVSADLDGSSIHVLGYNFDVGARTLKTYGEEMVEARQSRMKKMVKRIRDLGYEIGIQDVLQQSDQGNVGRPHLAKALLEHGYVDRIQEAFDRWLGRDQPGYVSLTRPTVVEAIEMIVDAGGLAVLAHPGRYADVSGHIERWQKAGLWGLEVRHPSHNRADEKRLIRLADDFGLGKTASNDWHGNEPVDIEKLGTVRFPDWWRREFVDALR